MSEIKGQLLGIILTLAVFTAVFGILIGVAQKSANSVQSKMESSFNLTEPENRGDTFIKA